MSGWTNGEEQDILEYWFAGTALPNTPSHIALYTVTPGETGGGTEATGGAYARVAFAKNTTNWGSSSGADPSTIQNAQPITFTEATASWGTVVAWGYLTGSTGGTLLAFGAISPTKKIDSGDTAEFAAGGLVFKLGDPGDSY